jgi:hypothetical protein
VRREIGYGLCLFVLLFRMSVRAQSEYHLRVVRPKVVSSVGQDFLCAGPYSISECKQQITILQRCLRRYAAERLGRWTWVVIRSDDWQSTLNRLHLDPSSPAFSQLEMRQTCVEEALLVPSPKRLAELMDKWHLPFDQFLDFAVTHELGHAMCGESDEIKAERFGRELRQGKMAVCSPGHQQLSAAAR